VSETGIFSKPCTPLERIYVLYLRRIGYNGTYVLIDHTEKIQHPYCK
jgi:hypothetical protein